MQCEIKDLKWAIDGSGDWSAYGVGNFKYDVMTMQPKAHYLAVREGGIKPSYSTCYETVDDAKASAQAHHNEEVIKYLNVSKADE